LASQCVSDTFASAVFENLLTPTQMFTEPLSTATGTQPFETPLDVYKRQVLGAGGNAVVAKVGTWSNGIGLSPAGAVSTQISSADGVWVNTYQICNLLTPVTCAQNTVTVTIITASILANPVSIIAPLGATAQPVGNVLTTDSVNGATPLTGTDVYKRQHRCGPVRCRPS